jgi:hypothetical protein
VKQGIDVSHFHTVAEEESQVFWVPGVYIRFIIVQPKQFHAVSIIIFLNRIPNKLAAIRMGCIVIRKIGWPLNTIINKHMLRIDSILVID